MKQIYWDVTNDTMLGDIWVSVNNKGLLAVQIGGKEFDFIQRLAIRYGGELIQSKNQVAPIMQQIEAYLEGRRKRFEIPIDWTVLSPFQQKVLQAVLAIPYGKTCSYGQIASKIGKPKAARAVGRANATNPIPLIIPCHRVIGSDGSLRGYGSGEGIQTKAWLLDLERSNSSII